MLKQPGLFFMGVRGALFCHTMNQSEVAGCNTILAAMEGSPLSYTAYALATAYHETAHTMQPINEYGGPSYFERMYGPSGRRPDTARQWGNTNPGDGNRFHGRGYVQLTWRNNYRKAGAALGVALEEHPELALNPDVAAKIMRRGMEEGWFTGHGFKSYLSPIGAEDTESFTEARHIINGSDRAEMIAGYAIDFQTALQDAGW